MAVTRKRFIARLAPPPCGGRFGPGPRADIARSTDPYAGTGSSFGRCSPPTGSTEQPHVPARREVNLKDRGEDGSPARVVALAEMKRRIAPFMVSRPHS